MHMCDVLIQDAVVKQELGAWIFLVLWCAGATIVTFVYGMQMDLQAAPGGKMDISVLIFFQMFFVWSTIFIGSL